MFVPDFPFQNPLEHALFGIPSWDPSSSLLSSLFLYLPFPPILLCTVDFCRVFFILCFTGIFLKDLFVIDYFFVCFVNLLQHLWLFAFFIVIGFLPPLFFWNFLDEFVCDWLLFCLFLEFIASVVTVFIFVIVYDWFFWGVIMPQAFCDARKITQ